MGAGRHPWASLRRPERKGTPCLAKTTATIDRERRDALYELVLDHLSGVGDFWIAIEEKDFAKAERLGIEFGEDFRLLEDIGWEPERDPAKVELPDEEVKVFSRDQLASVLAMAPERHRPLFELLAATGLRISEAIALQRLHLQLDQSEPEVCIRRAFVRDRIVPPKSKYGKREVRLLAPRATMLRAHLAAQPGQDSTALAFPSEAGGPLDPGNLRPGVLKPLAEEVGAPWAGFNTSRHTFASLHLSQGTNLLQLSRALGHHSPAFTLTRYTHLLPGTRPRRSICVKAKSHRVPYE